MSPFVCLFQFQISGLAATSYGRYPCPSKGDEPIGHCMYGKTEESEKIFVTLDLFHRLRGYDSDIIRHKLSKLQVVR
jgi:hypothetical protein